MLVGALQLAKLSLLIESRKRGAHAIRLGLMLMLYQMVCVAQGSTWKSASGLQLFQSQLLATAFFLSSLAIFGFSQSVTEEKEGETIGLLRLTGITPLSIPIGKNGAMLLEALVLVAVQLPFTIVAITLGGISWPQVYAGYAALVAFLWLLAAIGITMSVCRPDGASAARTTATVVALYALPPFLTSLSSRPEWQAMCETVGAVSLPVQLMTVTESGFQGSAWSPAVWFGIVAGIGCLLFAWWKFDSMAILEVQSGRSPLRLGTRRISRRAWSRPIIWREYVFSNGGLFWTVVRLAVPAVMFFLILGQNSGVDLGFVSAWTAIYAALFGILDGTWSVSRLFRDEIRYQTWSSLVQTPRSLSQIYADKIYGWGLGLAPTILAPFLFIYLTFMFHDFPIHSTMTMELMVGTVTVAMSVFGYLHLLILMSLYIGWKAIPATLTICFMAGWFYVISIFTARMDVYARCGAFFGTSVVITVVIWVLRGKILHRLEVLAETA
ncbi:hypothetical protein [Schlesneria sp.]|uniref:hypothetical protein n=1 Tax=Schlesneria sp. TaxID=2762018 RepID=UPI002F20A693